ncbi:MAG: (2Fe-2S)-binding protein [Deltaproteobacteria bacterium]|nr:(2Fe-2S)-binding protein [Deltaproteobacteria bacterium]
MKRRLSLTVNDEAWEVDVESQKTLLEVLREDIGFTGPNEGCGLGACGSCTVLVDGNPILSCLTLAAEMEGKDITTVEGLVKDGQPDPVQRAFIDHGAIQCGFCTPGTIMSAKALLDRNPHASRESIKEALAGNLCRCTGYQKIVDAVESLSGDAVSVK